MISAYRELVVDELRSLVPIGAVAMLGCPSHTNVGDQAIWLGQREAVAALERRPIVYSSGLDSFDPDELDRRLPHDGTILLTGGGNLGDLYPSEQEFREMVLRRFPDRRTMILPQSIQFREASARERARRAFEAHPELVLAVRTRRSLELARRHFDVPVRLMPDMAAALGRLPRSRERPDGAGTLFLLRRDREASGGSGFGSDDPEDGVVDWGDGVGEDGGLRALVSWVRWRRAVRHRHHLRAGLDYVESYLTRRAWSRVSAAISLLDGAETVVTDRLHGHILATLMGIPNVALDNSYGKVHAYVETWTGGSPLVRTAEDLQTAREAAKSLAGR